MGLQREAHLQRVSVGCAMSDDVRDDLLEYQFGVVARRSVQQHRIEGVARALSRKGGKLVLYGAQPLVAQVFETTSLNQIVPVRSDATAAAAAVRG